MSACYQHEKPVEKVLGTKRSGLSTTQTKMMCPKCDKLRHYKFTCKKCNSKNNYWASSDSLDYKCVKCKDTGSVTQMKDKGIGTKKIPSWRLNVDDASPEEVLTAKSDTFGMPLQSEEQWKKHYDEAPYEQTKKKQLREEKRELEKEVYGSEISPSI